MRVWLDFILPNGFEDAKKKVAFFRTPETLDFQLRDKMASKGVKGMIGKLHALVSFGHAFALVCKFFLDVLGPKCCREKGKDLATNFKLNLMKA